MPSPVSGRAGLAQDSERPAQGWGVGGGRPSGGNANDTIDFVRRISWHRITVFMGFETRSSYKTLHF